MTRTPRWRLSILCASAAFSVLSLVGCSREADDWRSAQAADTTAAYDQFLHQYPSSSHLKEANTRMGQLAEDEAWQLATSQDTQAGYQQFLSRYPEGKWAQEARVRIENFALTPPSTDSPATMMANMAGKNGVTPPPPAATPAGGADAPPAATAAAPAAGKPAGPASAPPAAAVVKPAATKPAAAKAAPAKPAAASSSSGFGVQLGAFASKAAADTAWSGVAKKFKADLGGAKHLVVAGKSGSAKVYRLRVAQASESAARALCGKLKPRHQACVVYHP